MFTMRVGARCARSDHNSDDGQEINMSTIKLESMLVAADDGSSQIILRPVVQHKWVYLFSEGNAQMRDLLGGKGAGLAEMASIGLPVPPGFTITTATCNHFTEAGSLPADLWAQVQDALYIVECQTRRRFGDPQRPLLVSVRSGVLMPDAIRMQVR